MGRLWCWLWPPACFAAPACFALRSASPSGLLRPLALVPSWPLRPASPSGLLRPLALVPSWPLRSYLLRSPICFALRLWCPAGRSDHFCFALRSALPSGPGAQQAAPICFALRPWCPAGRSGPLRPPICFALRPWCPAGRSGLLRPQALLPSWPQKIFFRPANI